MLYSSLRSELKKRFYRILHTVVESTLRTRSTREMLVSLNFGVEVLSAGTRLFGD